MRIIYNYTFNVTKKIKREEMIPVIVDYLEKYNLNYNDILFNLYSYKSSDSKKKNYFEKNCNDLFWRKYKYISDSSLAKETNVIGLSNLEIDSWKRKRIEEYDDLQVIIDRIQNQFIEMPQTSCNYRVSFNDIDWGTSVKPKTDIQDEWTTSLYPLSSNVTLWKDYLNNRYISLNFEMNITGYETYVKDFLDECDCPYNKDVIFVLDDLEKQMYSNANTFVWNILNKMDRNIRLQNAVTKTSDVLHIKRTLQKAFDQTDFRLVGFSNGLYTLSRIDDFNNKMDILFDYEKESKSFGATLIYKGAGYKHFIKFNDMIDSLSEENIKQYILSLLEKIRIFENDYVPTIVKKYCETPSWFKWN